MFKNIFGKVFIVCVLFGLLMHEVLGSQHEPKNLHSYSFDQQEIIIPIAQAPWWLVASEEPVRTVDLRRKAPKNRTSQKNLDPNMRGSMMSGRRGIVCFEEDEEICTCAPRVSDCTPLPSMPVKIQAKTTCCLIN